LQPWAAFYQPQVSEKSASKRDIGIFVEKWEPSHWKGELRAPAKTHPELVGRALALSVLDRCEWPEWLMNEDKSDLRLFDLEGVGPFLDWPPGKTPLSDYRKSTSYFLKCARETAHEAGVHQMFANHLEILKKLSFSHIVDLSGHPRSDGMKKMILRALDARQKAGISQAELAERIGTKQGVISRLEDADYEGHSLRMLLRVAAALGKRVSIEFQNLPKPSAGLGQRRKLAPAH
jgi:hypothetical protein